MGRSTRNRVLAEMCQTISYIEMPSSVQILTKIRYSYFVPYLELCSRLCLILETQPTRGDDSTSRVLVTDLDGVCIFRCQCHLQWPHSLLMPHSMSNLNFTSKSATLITLLRYSRTALSLGATLLVWPRSKRTGLVELRCLRINCIVRRKGVAALPCLGACNVKVP
jgi:hypothetical protein